MHQTATNSAEGHPLQVMSVLVPYDRAADYLYLDALGETRSEALAHFTFHMRFDLSLSEIFHLEFAEAVVHFGEEAALRSDLIPCLMPVRNGTVFVQGVASSESECRRIIELLQLQPDDFAYVCGGIKLTGVFVL